MLFNRPGDLSENCPNNYFGYSGPHVTNGSLGQSESVPKTTRESVCVGLKIVTETDNK